MRTSSRESTAGSMCSARLKNGTPPTPLRCSSGSSRSAAPAVAAAVRALEVDVHTPAVEQLGRPLYSATRLRYRRSASSTASGSAGSASGQACAAPPAPTATRCGSGAASSSSSRT